MTRTAPTHPASTSASTRPSARARPSARRVVRACATAASKVVVVGAGWGGLGAAKTLFGLPIRELAVASNAAVGGPTTAAAMATAKGWDDLVLPALLVGILGYATGTFVSIGLLSMWVR